MIEDKYSNFTPHEADEYYFYTNNCNFYRKNILIVYLEL